MLSRMNAAAVRARAIPAPMLYEYGPHTGGATVVPSPAAPWHLRHLVAYTRAPAAVSAGSAADGDGEAAVGDGGVGGGPQGRWRGGARAIRTTGTSEDDRGSQAQGREGMHREADSITLCRGSPLPSAPLQPFRTVTHPTPWRSRSRAPFPFSPRSSMLRWPLVFVFAAKVLAGEQQPEARPDSARVARVLALLETSDSTVCELAAQAIGNVWGWSWQPEVFPIPMPMPMPAPMPMPMMRQGFHGPRARVHVNRRAGWRGADSAAFGAFRAVLRDDNRCVRNIAARVLGRAGAPGSYDAFAALLREAAPGLRETGALGLGELEARRALRPLQDALRDRDARV